MTLAAALRDLADDAERGALPHELAERLARVVDGADVRRRRRDTWLRIAASHCGGSASALHRVIRREGWRLAEWRRRGAVPERATPLQAALYAACEAAGGPLPGRRMLAHILATDGPHDCQDARLESPASTP